MMGQLLGFIPWDDSKDVWNNLAGGAQDLAEKWTNYRIFGGNLIDGKSNPAAEVVKGVTGAVNDSLSVVKKYWYVPVIVGGVIIGYKLIKGGPNAQLIRALNNLRIPE